MRFGRTTRAVAGIASAALLLGGCGGSGEGGATVASRPAPPKSAFPSSHGHSLAEVLSGAEQSKLVVSQGAQVFYKGRNRFPIGVFEQNGKQVSDADVALYFAKVPKVAAEPGKGGAEAGAAKANAEALEGPSSGPFPARVESIETEPAFRALTTSQDPHAATSVYVSDVDFPSDGEWRIAALVKEGGKLKATLLPSVQVGAIQGIPRVGQKAPLIHTLTPADVGGDLSKITTRIPPDTQNRVDYADALGKEPIMLLFATPQFCVSRVCGPVVDVAEQVKQENEGKAAFVHNEIYVEKGPPKTRSQVQAFRLPTDPWLFAIDKQGVMREVVQGAFGVEEMTRALKKAGG